MGHMRALTANDRSTLVKLLGMVGSAHDGEVITAARKAHKLLAAKGFTWSELLALPSTTTPPVSPAPPEPYHLAEARELLKRGKAVITRWEHDFLLGIMAFRQPRPAQLETLKGIRAKVNAATSGS